MKIVHNSIPLKWLVFLIVSIPSNIFCTIFNRAMRMLSFTKLNDIINFSQLIFLKTIMNRVNKIVSSYFDKMYKNADDLHDKETFLRQYYTMPVTTVPDNRIKFAKWCYKGKRKCKTNNNCYNNVYSPLNNVIHR